MLTADGRPIANARVILRSDSMAETISAYTGQLGYYNFTDIPVGNSYVVTVKSRRFHFTQPSQILNLNDDVSNLNFVADPQE